MRVVLHRVGRNLNRAYRTCEAFGVEDMILHRCDGHVAGNLFKAAGRVRVSVASELPRGAGVLCLETGAGIPIRAVEWDRVHTIVVGGETSGLPRRQDAQWCCIAMVGNVSGLTVEAALAIALHEWRREC